MAATDFETATSHPFYPRLNQLLRTHGFDDFAEAQCATFYADTLGRPSLPPGIYFGVALNPHLHQQTRSRPPVVEVIALMAIRSIAEEDRCNA